MATSLLRLFKTKLTPEKNFIVEGISSYLRNSVKVPQTTFTNFQYQKIEPDMTVKITMEQSKQHDLGYNYAFISEDNKTYYFFIINTKWISQSCLELTLSMDTVNTYYGYISGHFTDKTKITRQHKDRYYNPGASASELTTLYRIVDKVDEGTGTLTKYRDSINNVSTLAAYQISGAKWYLVYTSATDDDNSGVNCYICADRKLKISETGYHNNIFKTKTRYLILKSDNTASYSVQIGTTTYTDRNVIFTRSSVGGADQMYYKVYNASTGAQIASGNVVETSFKIMSDVNIRVDSGSWDDVSDIDSFNTLVRIKYISQESATYVVPISSIDRTDSKLIKIIELPYCPTRFSASGDLYTFWDVGYDKTIGALKVYDLNMQFTSKVVVSDELYELSKSLPTLAQRKSYLKNIWYESKLWKSDYFTFKYLYDSFSKEILLENVDTTAESHRPTLNVDYYQSTNVNSNIAFNIKVANYKSTEDFDQWLICNRNNELPVYNNSYINYLRNGYNYDVKNKNAQTTFNWINTGIQIAGAVGSAVATAFTGNPITAASAISLGTSAISSIANNINTTISAERNISQKLQEAKAQSTSVSGSDDLSLLNAYDGQVLKEATYSVSDNMKSVLFDLFHYCGYADGRQAIPSLDSRRCFNYVQCEPVFDNEDNPVWIKYVDDIKARFKAGITVLHSFNNGTETYWDFEQKYENFETWICDRS